jgi:hypothetical protein
MTKLLHRVNDYNYWPYIKMLMIKLLHRLNIYNYGPYAKMPMTKLLYRLNVGYIECWIDFMLEWL